MCWNNFFHTFVGGGSHFLMPVLTEPPIVRTPQVLVLIYVFPVHFHGKKGNHFNGGGCRKRLTPFYAILCPAVV